MLYKLTNLFINILWKIRVSKKQLSNNVRKFLKFRLQLFKRIVKLLVVGPLLPEEGDKSRNVREHVVKTKFAMGMKGSRIK
jgi:hypothetical protein